MKRGVFCKTKKTKYGEAKSTPLELLIHEVENDNNKCFGGIFLFNQLGLTTQVPTIIEILNNKSSYKIKIGHTTAHYSKIRPIIKKNNKGSIIILEVIKKIKSIPDANMKNTVEWLQKAIDQLTPAQIKQLVITAMNYTPKTRAILGTLLSKNHPNQAEKIKASLNENSYYTIGSLLDYLNTPQEWGLKN